MYEPNGPVPQADFTEGIFIDYRSFDRAKIKPIYEFGFGLSYAKFKFSNLRVSKTNAGPYRPTGGLTLAAPTFQKCSTNAADYAFPANLTRVPQYIYPYLNDTNVGTGSRDGGGHVPAGARDGSPQPIPAAGGAPGGNPQLYDVLYQVRATITNIGNVGGEEVPQLYVSLGGPHDAKIVLRGFQRLSIDGHGGSAIFNVDLTRRDLSNWDSVAQNWLVSSYPKTVYVGSSSRNLPLSAVLP